MNQIVTPPQPEIKTKLTHNPTDIPIVHLLYQTYKRWHELIGKFPKSERYTLGRTSQQLLLTILKRVLAASVTISAEQKRSHLQLAITDLDTIKLLVRLCKDCKCLPNSSYLEIESLLHQIGKMQGGWLKSIR